MYAKLIISILFAATVRFAAAQSISPRKTDWPVTEVKKWAEQNKEHSTWHGWLLYQGSDSIHHHFISRVMDEWIWFALKRADIIITDERIYKRTSSAPLGYFYVDATKDFAKIKDY